MEHLARYEVTAAIFKEGKQWVSRCEELNVSSCGRTVDEAFGNLQDALEVYMDTLEEHKEVEHLLAMKELHPIAKDGLPEPDSVVFRAPLSVAAPA